MTIRTSDFAAGAWAPTGTTVIPAGAPVALNFYATNLPGNAYQAAYARVDPQQLLGFARAALDAAVVEGAGRRARSRARGATSQSVVRVPLRDEARRRVRRVRLRFPHGAGLGELGSWLTGIVQLTNLGVFAQWFPAHGIVLVQHLSDGAPVRAAAVTVYRARRGQKLAAAAVRDGSDRCERRARPLAASTSSAAPSARRDNNAPNIGVVVDARAPTSRPSPTWNYSGVSRFDVYGGWTSGAPLSRGTIFTDRQMYQPGERGEITGLAYYVKGNRVVADANAPYKVTLTDPSNNASPLGQVRTDAFGVFSLPIVFSKQQALGYYSVDAKGTNGNEINGSLRVAQFKPPNFKLTLTLGATSATAGSSVRASVAAAYLFGAPLQGGTAHAYVTRDVANVQPKGWDDFSFGPQWFYPEQTPSFDTDVLQRDLALDGQGNASFDVAVPGESAVPDDVSRRHGDDRRLESLRRRLEKLSRAGRPTRVIGLASDTVGKAGTRDADPRDRDGCRRQSRSRAARCISSCRR